MARHFDPASSQYLERSSAVLTAGPLTFACWYKPGAALNNVSLIGLYASGNDTESFRMHMHASGGAEIFDITGGAALAITSSAPGFSSGIWHHYCVTRTSNASRAAYLDGANKVSDTTSHTFPTGLNTTSIGRVGGASKSNFADGDIAEAAIWNVALSDTDVAALGAGVSPLFVRPDALVFYAPLLGSYSPEIDLIGHNDLTLGNAPTAITHARIIYPHSARFTTRAATVGGSLANTSTVKFSTSANLGSANLASATTFKFSTAANLGSAALASRASFGFSSSFADLRVNSLRNASAVRFVTTDAFLDFTSPPRGFYSLRINGHERGHLVQWDGLSIDQQLGSRKVANFVIDDPDGTYFPLVGETVVITQVDGVTREFYGSIETAARTGVQGLEGGVKIVTTVQCTSREQVFDRHLVFTSYANKTLRAIVLDIVANYLVDEDITVVNVETGPTIESAVFPYISVTEAFNDLVNLTGYSYWLDDNDGLHFQARSSVPAPFDLDDDPLRDMWAVRDFTVTQTRQDYRNRQLVRAGIDLTISRTELFRGDGTTKTFSVSFPVGREPSVTVNGVSKTVGIRGVETGFDWYWNKSLNAISQDDGAAALIVTDALAITYQGEYPIIASAQDDAEILSRKTVEQGSGIYESIEQDGTINSSALALAEAQGYINQYGLIKDQITYWTYRSGLRVGQIQRITSSKFGVQPLSGYLITSVNVAGVEGWPGMKWTITALSGAGVGGWIEFFQGIAAAARQFVIRQDEILLTQNAVREVVFIQDSVAYEIS